MADIEQKAWTNFLSVLFSDLKFCQNSGFT
jgi:hypothetical protein